MARVALGRIGVPILLLATACGGETGPGSGTAIVDSAGVAIATAPAADMPLGWTFTEVFRLGGADEGPGSFTTARPGSTGVDDAGNFYALDNQQYRVEVFGPTGEHLRFLGRQGGGPGELEFPISLFVGPTGIVHVLDISKRALVRWDADGEIMDPVSIQGLSPGAIKAYGDTLLFDQQTRTPEERNARLLQVVASDTVELTSHGGPAGGMVQFSCVAYPAAPVFTPSLAWTSNGRLTAATKQTPYQVDVYRGPTLVRSIRRPIPPKATTEADVARLHPEGVTVQFGGGGGCTIPVSEMVEKQGTAPVVPQVRALVLDPQGRLWVERYTFDDEPDQVDLFSAEGEYLGTMTGRGLPLGFPRADLVLFAEENPDTGVSQVVAYQISGRP